MNAIILAAGRGSRMGALTEGKPKCLAVLKDRALLDWQISALKGAAVENIAAVCGYQAAMIQRPGLHTFLNSRWESTNMLASLLCAAEWLRQGDCLVSYGDIVYPPDTVRTLAASEAGLAIAYNRQWLKLWQARFENPLADAETFKLNPGGFIREIGLKTNRLADIEGQYMGLLKFTPRGWGQVENFLASRPPAETDKSDMTSLLQRLIQAGVQLKAVPVDGRWLEVDNENDLKLYEKALSASGDEITGWLVG